MDEFNYILKDINLKDTFENINLMNQSLDHIKQVEIIPIDKVSPDEIREYQKKSIELLRQITDNTASIADLVSLVSQNNDKQDELIVVMTQVLEIAKAKTKEEAGNKYTQVMKKITTGVENAETMQKLTYFAMLTYNTVTANIDKIAGHIPNIF